jgi:hypothetical protein
MRMAPRRAGHGPPGPSGRGKTFNLSKIFGQQRVQDCRWQVKPFAVLAVSRIAAVQLVLKGERVWMRNRTQDGEGEGASRSEPFEAYVKPLRKANFDT